VKAQNIIKPLYIMHFTRHIATLLEAGFSLVDSINLYAKQQRNTAMRDLAHQLMLGLKQGKAFSDLLCQYPKAFDALYCGLIRTGEHASTLPQMMHALCQYLERSHHIKAQIKAALFYPVCVLSLSMVISVILLIVVVPQFSQLFSDHQQAMPMFTRIVINLSSVLIHHGWIGLILMMIISFVFTKLYQRYTQLQFSMQTLLLRLPIIGGFIRQTQSARICRSLSISLNAGMSATDALSSCLTMITHIGYQNELKTCYQNLHAGKRFSLGFQNPLYFPSMMADFIHAGERAGQLDNLLLKVADHLESELDRFIKHLNQRLEPLLMVILGLIIGSIVLAMYLPIFNLGNAM